MSEPITIERQLLEDLRHALTVANVRHDLVNALDCVLPKGPYKRPKETLYRYQIKGTGGNLSD